MGGRRRGACMRIKIWGVLKIVVSRANVMCEEDSMSAM